MINTMTLNITNNISLKNSFSYREFEISRRFDLDGTTLQILDVINPFKGYTKLRTEEVQLRADFDRARGVIGYYDAQLSEPYALASQTVQDIAALAGSVPPGRLSESAASTRAASADVKLASPATPSRTPGNRRPRHDTTH